MSQTSNELKLPKGQASDGHSSDGTVARDHLSGEHSADELSVGNGESQRSTEKTVEPNPDAAGMVIVYTGSGKGKTTAALGLAWRALGQGLKVAVVQYVKGKWRTGERVFAESVPALDFHVMGLGFTWESDDISKDKAAAIKAWNESKDLILGGKHDVVILDEITYVINYGFIDLHDVVTTLKVRPAHVTVVVTGRNAPPDIQELADLVTDMTVVKHPYKSGRKALRGIDY